MKQYVSPPPRRIRHDKNKKGLDYTVELGNDNHFVIPSQDGIQKIKSGSIQNFPPPSTPRHIFCNQEFIDIQDGSSYTLYITSCSLREVFVKDLKRKKWKKKRLFV
jgi:hypothetical protein